MKRLLWEACWSYSLDSQTVRTNKHSHITLLLYIKEQPFGIGAEGAAIEGDFYVTNQYYQGKATYLQHAAENLL